ncbi:uncharacterized protein LOC105848925 [Hydra vulgaris]|uniref:uncharacterized protein LOC105848925 n=1 Tax=Hydra vulgaris TaxID=6087 RepID=UPI0032E9E04E
MVKSLPLDTEGANKQAKYHTNGIDELEVFQGKYNLGNIYRFNFPTKTEFTWRSQKENAKNKKHIKKIENKIQRERQNTNPNLDSIKEKRDALFMLQFAGAFIRTNQNIIEEEEKPLKLLYNLEKIQQWNMSITEIRKNDSTLASELGCTNSSYKLEKLKNKTCFQHEGKILSECGCELPFRMFCFPSLKRNSEKRKHWISQLRREGKKKGSAWEPGTANRVCSDHFVDKIPTVMNPNPTINMACSLTEKSIVTKFPSVSFNADVLSSILSDHTYSMSLPLPNKCTSCEYKSSLITSYVSKVNSLTNQLKKLKIKQTVKSKQKFSWKLVNNDKKMNFYTGISSIAIFNVIFGLLKPFLPSILYWRGPKHLHSKVKQLKSVSKCKLLSHREELLMTLMRLRLGLLNEDMADRFGISKSLCSNTFTAFIRIIANILGQAIIVWLPSEVIKKNLPQSFVKAKHHKCRVILDCFEIFIELLKSLYNQAVTCTKWIHNGRASDKFITSDSGFYDLLEKDDEVMADRGFQIREELLFRYCSLSVPPGARVKSQMTASECKKTTDVANLRIHIERAINRIKTFRILKNVLPISMLHHMDDIILSCAALCNLKPALIKKIV